MAKLTLAVALATLAVLIAACTTEPLNEERFRTLLSAQEAHEAIGLHIADETHFLDISEVVREEERGKILGLVDRYAMSFVTEGGLGTVSLEVWEFATDRHARERLEVLIARSGLTATDRQVGYRSVEGAIGGGHSASLTVAIEVSFTRGRRVVSLYTSADLQADLIPYRDGLLELAELVDARL